MKGQTEGATEFTGVGEWGEITEVWYIGKDFMEAMGAEGRTQLSGVK